MSTPTTKTKLVPTTVKLRREVYDALKELGVEMAANDRRSHIGMGEVIERTLQPALERRAREKARRRQAGGDDAVHPTEDSR